MIKNLPTSDEFVQLSIQYLAQSVDHILNTEKSFGDSLFNDKDLTDDLWDERQGVLGNSLIMLFLSIENFLKSRICTVSPLLLISGEPNKWRVKNKDKDFEDLHIHQFDDLLVIYQEIESLNIDIKVKQTFEELRKKRNKCTHGVHREKLIPDYIFDVMHKFLSFIWGKEWLVAFREIMLIENIYGLDSKECEDMHLLQYFSLFQKYYTQKEFRSLIAMPQEGRRYFCPHCEVNADEFGTIYDSDFALITNNKNEIYCYLCEAYSEVRLGECDSEKCKGNVIYETSNIRDFENDICLSCTSVQIS